MPKLANIKANLLVVVQEKEGVFLARCPFLNVVSHAASRDKAIANLREEIEIQFDCAWRDGSLIDMLEYRTSTRREPVSPNEFVQLEITSTDVDLPTGIPEHLLKRFADSPEFSA